MRNQRYHECASFVKELHKEQTDKGGNPYYHHLYEVANNAKAICQKLNIDDEDFIYDCMEMGLLHDSVEDCELSFEVITDKYGNEVANGVYLITKPKSKSQNTNIDGLFDVNYVAYLGRLYEAYLDNQSCAIKAMIVKLSDLKSNLNYRRLGVLEIDELTQKQLTYLLKYHTAHQLLSSIIFNDKKISVEAFKQSLLSAKMPHQIDTVLLKNAIDDILI